MHQIEISDQLFVEAALKAAANGLSVERFVAEAVRLHLYDEPEAPEAMRLSAEQVELVRQAQMDIEAGHGLAMDEVEHTLALRKAGWKKGNPA